MFSDNRVRCSICGARGDYQVGRTAGDLITGDVSCRPCLGEMIEGYIYGMPDKVLIVRVVEDEEL